MNFFDRWWPYVEEVWKLLRGSASNRFSATLVRCGTVLVAGPPFYVLLAFNLLDRVSPQQTTIDGYLSVGGFICGVILIAIGIWTFHRYHAAVFLPDGVTIQLPGGWSFRDTVVAIADEHKVLFEGFTQSELDTPVLENKIKCGSILRAVHLVSYSVSHDKFPAYSVSENDGLLVVRATHV